jgi:hypothetical protein
MNTSGNRTKEARKIHVHVIDVVEQVGEGHTVVLQVFPDAEMTSREIWGAALPGDFRGATKVDRLWHLYYGKDPGCLPGDWLELDLPDATEKE